MTHIPFIGVQGLLARLEKVKPGKPGTWMARSPCRNDKTPSLSVRELDDGRVLLHDFGGSDYLEILGCLGIAPIEMIPEHLRHARETAPNARRAPPIPWADAFKAIAFQSSVVLISAEDMAQGRALDDTALNQLANAVAVIENALSACKGGAR